MSLSDKIENAGFNKEVKFKNKEGKILIVNATKWEAGLKVKDVKKAVKEDLENWGLVLKSIQIANGKLFGDPIKAKLLRMMLLDIEKNIEMHIREAKNEIFGEEEDE